MVESFDPYRKWLGIPEAQRPPTHYQILGIATDESDLDVINGAVIRLSAYVRNFQSGKFADHATRLLNEIAAAKACLLNPQQRVDYDRTLKPAIENKPAALGTQPVRSAPRASNPQTENPPPVSPHAGPASARRAAVQPLPAMASILDELPLAPATTRSPLDRPYRKRSGMPRGLSLALATVGAVAALALIALVVSLFQDRKPRDGAVADGGAAARVPAQAGDAAKGPAEGGAVAQETGQAKMDSTKPNAPPASGQAADPPATKDAGSQIPALAPPIPPQPANSLDLSPVNLLAQVNPQRDQVRGSWRTEQGSLVTPLDQAATLVIPYSVPKQYTLTVVAERTVGTDSLNLGLIVGGRPAMLALEGWGVLASGLNTVNGRTADNNETTFKSPIFAKGRPSTIVCTVRESSVQVSCNGQPIINWSGDVRQLALDRRYWTNIPADKLFVGTWATTFRISKLELAPLAQ